MDRKHTQIRGYRHWILEDGTRIPLISGSDGDEPTPLPEVPENLDDLTEDQLRSLHGELLAAEQALLSERETDGISFARVREIRDQVRAGRSHMERIADAVVERAGVEGDLSALPEAQALPETVETPPAPTAAETSEAGDGGEETAPAAEGAPAGEPAGAGAHTAATAELSADEIAAQREHGAGPASQREAIRPRVASLRVPVGSRIAEPDSEMTLDDFGAAITDIARGRSFDGQVRVASLPAFESHAELRDRMLSRANGPIRTDEQIAEAVSEWRAQFDANQAAARSAGARVAAICDPLDIIRDIPNAVVASEPFSDSLPSRPAGRLGYQFTPPLGLSDVSTGVAVWDETDQSSVDPDDSSTWKPIVDISCGTPSDVTAVAITGAARFDNTTEMSSPERIRDLMVVLAGQRARAKEAHLLTLMDTFTSHFDYVAPYGALPGVIQAVLSTLPQGQYPNRLDESTPYVLYMPPGVLELCTVDATNKAYVTDADLREVAGYIEAACNRAGWNVSVVDLLDVAGTTNDPTPPFSALPAVGVANRVPLPGLGQTYRLRLVAPESFIYASTGLIDYGVERSPELNRQNKAQVFAEEYVMLAKHGPQPSYTIHATLCPAGDRAGLSEPFTCSASSPS